MKTEEEVEKLRNPKQWTSVKDKLPEVGKPCFIIAPYFGTHSIARYIWSNEFGHVFRVEGWGATYNVTHYIVIELPEPPKQ